MGENSKIEWTHHTWNLWRGCTEVSPACDHCYARELAKRNPAVLGQWGPDAPRVLGKEDYRGLPQKWNEQAKAAGERRRVFSLSMGDWLDEEAPAEWLAELCDMVRMTPWLDWQLLTKRPQNFMRRITEAMVRYDVSGQTGVLYKWMKDWRDGKPPANVWVGTTVEDQTRAEERIPHLLKIPARVRFLSCEPLLGPIDLVAVRRRIGPLGQNWWVIAGGESGHHARPMHPEWVRGLRDQCEAARVAFFFKQWGEWAPAGFGDAGAKLVRLTGEVGEVRADTCDEVRGSVVMRRATKRAAGRRLDGREWSGFPTVEVAR